MRYGCPKNKGGSTKKKGFPFEHVFSLVHPMCTLSLNTPNLLCEHYFSYHQTNINFIPFKFFYINHNICAKLYTRKKILKCVTFAHRNFFCSKLGFVWINGYDLICILHLMILKVPHQGNFCDFNHHCYTSICNNFDGLSTITLVIELLFNFSHSLACTSIGELWRSCSSSLTNSSSHQLATNS